MPPRQVVPQPCGCIDELWGHGVFTNLCQQHLTELNTRGSRPQPNMIPPQGQRLYTTGGIQSNHGFPFQMGGFAPHGQMPQMGARR